MCDNCKDCKCKEKQEMKEFEETIKIWKALAVSEEAIKHFQDELRLVSSMQKGVYYASRFKREEVCF